MRKRAAAVWGRSLLEARERRERLAVEGRRAERRDSQAQVWWPFYLRRSAPRRRRLGRACDKVSRRGVFRPRRPGVLRHRARELRAGGSFLLSRDEVNRRLPCPFRKVHPNRTGR